MSKYLIVALLLMTGFNPHTIAQVVIKGRVMSEEDKPIAEAEVFLNNTSYSTKSGADGQFQLEVEFGSYELIVYKRSYKPVVYPLLVDQPLDVQVRLSELTVRLKQQQVTADRAPEWYENLAIFKENFLGSGKNGRSCRILNPQVLVLDGDAERGSLRAWANEPLLIRNKQLGYDITYVLEEFTQNKEKFSYLGYVRYMDTPGLELKKKHFKARQSAYEGSVMHLIRSILDAEVKEAGFELRRLVKNGNVWNSEPAEFQQLVHHANEYVYLQGPGVYSARYIHEKPELAYSRNRSGIHLFQVSELEIKVDQVKIWPSGAIDPPLGIEFRGYMGWERLGDALPLDYEVVTEP